MRTVSNLLLHPPPLDMAVRLFAKALHDSDKRVGDLASDGLFKLGRELSDESAVGFERQVNSSTYELALRLILVGYYFMARHQSKTAGTTRRAHILWLIENATELAATGHPECSLHASEDQDGYDQAKRLWLAKTQSNPNNAIILVNAASFFTLDDPTLSEQLLRQGQLLESKNPAWAEKLGHLYSLRIRKENRHDELMATQSFRSHQDAEQVRAQCPVDDGANKIGRLHSLSELARSAFDARELEQATNYATELLSLATSKDLDEFFRNDGNAIYQGNLVLGRVAVEMGDIERAKLHLLASGRTKGSPSLDSFGPNMSLARDLLERGERETVLEFFQLCSKFWRYQTDTLESWIEETKQGRIPEFGANLDY